MLACSNSNALAGNARTILALAAVLLAAIPIVPWVPVGPHGHSPPEAIAGARADGSNALPASFAALLGMSVSIELPGPAVDPGAPFALAADVQGLYASPLSFRWNDSLGVPGGNRTITLVAPASGNVSASVTVTDGVGSTASASATVGIGAAPSIAVSALAGGTDVGLPLPIAISVNGSFPPFSVSWAPRPGGASSTALLRAAGEVQATTEAVSPGFEWIEATVTDHYSVATTVDGIVATIHPRPEIVEAPVAPVVDAGAPAVVMGLVVGGTPPFAWTANASLPAANVSSSSGSIGPSPPIEWSGRFAEAGNATVEIDLTDAAGLFAESNATVLVRPAPAASIAVLNSSPHVGSPLDVRIHVTGGVPPYALAIALSDGERASEGASGAGPVDWSAHPTGAGALEIDVTLKDAIGGEGTAETTVVLDDSAPPPDPTSSEPGPGTAKPPHVGPVTVVPNPGGRANGSSGAVEALAGATLLALGGAVSALWWRRRRRHPAPDHADPSPGVEVIRRLLEGSEGTEAAALAVLAEEEGLTEAEVRSVVKRLEADGAVEIERGPEGSEVLRWVGAGGSTTGSAGDS